MVKPDPRVQVKTDEAVAELRELALKLEAGALSLDRYSHLNDINYKSETYTLIVGWR